jgi:cell division protein FtsA
VLTGGTAKLPGIAGVAARVFGVPAHLGEAPTWISENLRDPGYHTALGLLYCGVGSRSERLVGRGQSSGFLSGLRKLFSHS